MMKKYVFTTIGLLYSLALFAQSGAFSLETAQRLPAQGYPYGSIQLMKTFSSQWENTPNKANNKSYPESTTLDTLSAAMYRDFTAPTRKSLSGRHLHNLFPPQYLKKQGLEPAADTGTLLLLKLSEAHGICVYSAMIQQDIPCRNCEYPPQQLLNMLFTASGNKIIDRLLFTYSKGSDLERRERYGYIDQQGNILIKDFSADELNGYLLNKQKWRVTAKGTFRKIQ
ncbi:hypothetical protein [Chitinophaga qingshengii]|uniref:WG repeat-containing protein n=1 Tax=Chitinophaga qingshengii TaxID=1569794 RepID=A0ABR7TL30_9BACT|nr:hypothetical protein [Chitinophaga qingshengii]MBC9931201.1 hypothetical protein [Chitinophaga qingshengii]